MQFNPKDIDDMLLPDGDTCDFEVIKAEEKRSKSGNQMIEILLKVWGSDGKQRNIFHYLVFAAHVKAFCEATNQMKKFDSGVFGADDALGKAGKLVVKIEIDTKGIHPDKNAVKRFIKAGTSGVQNNFLQEAAKQAAASRQSSHASDLEPPPFDDTIPF